MEELTIDIKSFCQMLSDYYSNKLEKKINIKYIPHYTYSRKKIIVSNCFYYDTFLTESQITIYIRESEIKDFLEYWLSNMGYSLCLYEYTINKIDNKTYEEVNI